MDTELAPIGWYVGHALDSLAELYRRIAEMDRREGGADRRARADHMELAARIATDAASDIRRDAFAASRGTMQ